MVEIIAEASSSHSRNYLLYETPVDQILSLPSKSHDDDVSMFLRQCQGNAASLRQWRAGHGGAAVQ